VRADGKVGFECSKRLICEHGLFHVVERLSDMECALGLVCERRTEGV
jgi:hypothetical protein